jgi:hypothetical protein
MTKNTKTAITIGAVAIVGYFVWNRIVASTHKGSATANAAGPLVFRKKKKKKTGGPRSGSSGNYNYNTGYNTGYPNTGGSSPSSYPSSPTIGNSGYPTHTTNSGYPTHYSSGY